MQRGLNIKCLRRANTRRSADIEVSEATYNYKIGFMEILVSEIALSVTITRYFETTSKVTVYRKKFSNPTPIT